MGRHKDPKNRNSTYQRIGYKPVDTGSVSQLVLLAINKIHRRHKKAHTTLIAETLNECTNRNFRGLIIGPTIDRLLKKKLITVYKKKERNRGGKQYRVRNYYKFTDDGRKRLRKIKSDFYKLYNGLEIDR